MNNQKTNIYDLLAHLEKRTALYLGNDYTFQSLDAFITGFGIGCARTQLETKDYNNFADFNIWILGYLPEHYGKSGGWHWQISNRNPNDDENAFKEFFEFLEVFKTAKRKVEKIQIEKFEFEKTEYNAKTNTEIKKREVVDSVHKITMEHSNTIWIEGFDKNRLTYENWCITENEYQSMLKKLSKINITDVKN